MQGRKGVDDEHNKALALTKAFLEASKQLGLTPAESALVLGIPAPAFANIKKLERLVDGLNGEAERASGLVRMTKRLSTLLEGGETTWRSWIRRDNPDLGLKPLDMMRQRDGLLKIVQYLDKRTTLSQT